MKSTDSLPTASTRRLSVRPTAATQILRTVWNHPANRSGRLSAVVRTLKFQLRARATGRPTEVGLGDRSRVLAYHDGAGSKRAAYAPMPDWNEMQVWKSALASGDLFVDVGANVGLYSVLMAEFGCEVIAFEPIDATADQLEKNLALNGYEATVMRCALADEPGSMKMAGPDALRQHLVDDDGSAEGTTVPVKTLDDVVGERIVAGLKIDVEGAERMVLLGGSVALSEGRIRLLQLEWNDMAEKNFGEDRRATVELLTGFGYSLFRPDERGVLHPLSDAVLGSDIFARRT